MDRYKQPWIKFILKPRWTVEGFEEMDKRSWYLSLSNHQSWADIFSCPNDYK